MTDETPTPAGPPRVTVDEDLAQDHECHASEGNPWPLRRSTSGDNGFYDGMRHRAWDAGFAAALAGGPATPEASASSDSFPRVGEVVEVDQGLVMVMEVGVYVRSQQRSRWVPIGQVRPVRSGTVGAPTWDPPAPIGAAGGPATDAAGWVDLRHLLAQRAADLGPNRAAAIARYVPGLLAERDRLAAALAATGGADQRDGATTDG